MTMLQCPTITYPRHTQDPDRVTESYDMLVGAMCLWGFVQGIASGPIQALYADSIPTGNRAETSFPHSCSHMTHRSSHTHTGQRTKFYHYLFAACKLR